MFVNGARAKDGHPCDRLGDRNPQGLNTVEVEAEVTGKVLTVHVDDNDRVTAWVGSLPELDPEQLRASVDEASAQVLSADANILHGGGHPCSRTKQARVTCSRSKQSRGSSRKKDSSKQAQVGVVSAQRLVWSPRGKGQRGALGRASLKSAQSRLGKTKIVAPSNGIVLVSARWSQGRPSPPAIPGTVPFGLAEDLTKKLSLRVDVDEADVGRVKQGSEGELHRRRLPASDLPHPRSSSLRNEPKTSQSVVSYEAVLTVDNAVTSCSGPG